MAGSAGIGALTCLVATKTQARLGYHVLGCVNRTKNYCSPRVYRYSFVSISRQGARATGHGSCSIRSPSGHLAPFGPGQGLLHGFALSLTPSWPQVTLHSDHRLGSAPAPAGAENVTLTKKGSNPLNGYQLLHKNRRQFF